MAYALVLAVTRASIVLAVVSVVLFWTHAAFLVVDELAFAVMALEIAEFGKF